MMKSTLRLAPIALAASGLLTTPAEAQESAAIFDAPVVVAGSNHRFETLVDLNGDGFQDVASWWWYNEAAEKAYFYGWINDQSGVVDKFNFGGPGFWSANVDIDVALQSTSTQVGMERIDLNGDAYDDFYVLFRNQTASQLVVFISSGSGLLKFTDYELSLNQRIDGLVFEDFNDDGVTDQAILMGSTLEVWEYSGPSPGNMTKELRDTRTLPAAGDGLVAIDANSDAIPDLCINLDDQTRVYPVMSCVTQTPAVFGHGIVEPVHPVAGDIDNDGDEDLVVFAMTRYVVLRRTGPSTFTPESQVYGGPATHFVDIDGDGDLDGACCGGGCGCCGPCPARNDLRSTFRVSFNDGTGTFSDALELGGLGANRLAGAADMDGDGDIDLVAGRCIYYARGSITGDITPALPAIQTEVSVRDADLDGDDDLDFGIDLVRRGQGDGTFVDGTTIVIGVPAGVTLIGPGFPGDFDGDGDTDLIVGSEDTNTAAFLGTRLLYGNGGGLVDAGVVISPTSWSRNPDGKYYPIECLVADIDGDGDLDVQAMNRYYWDPPKSSPKHAATWFNKNGGTKFTPGTTYWGSVIRNVGDFDNDGIPDALFQNTQSGKMSLDFGVGDGTFTPGTTYFGGSDLMVAYDNRIVVDDIDGDGDLDIAAAEFSNFTKTRVYINTGGGNFPFASSYELDYPLDNNDDDQTGTFSEWIDVNGDGLRDWILGPSIWSLSAAYVVLRDPTDTFWEEPVEQVLFGNDDGLPLFIPGAFRDVDSDGDIDFLTDRVVENVWNDGPTTGGRRQYGTGAPGDGGMTPTLGVSGTFVVGEPATFHITGAVGGTYGVFVYGLTEVDLTNLPFPGMTTYVFPFFASQVLPIFGPAEPGEGRIDIPYVVPPPVLGTTWVHQLYVADPSTPFGASATNGLEIWYGQ